MLTLNILSQKEPLTLNIFPANPTFILNTIPKKKQPIKKYTLEIFLERARSVHGINRFDYSLVTKEHIVNSASRVPVICYAHEIPYKWDVVITNHINSGHGCPSCKGCVKYTLESFLIRANRAHNNKYDYSLVTKEHIKGAMSKVTIICYAHEIPYKWDMTITNHINQKQGCIN